MKTETYACAGCGTEVERPIARGQRPKWCPDCRRRTARVRTCKSCGKTRVIYDGVWHCSAECKPRRRPNPKPVQLTAFPLDQRSDLRRGYEDRNARLFFTAVRRYCEVDDAGCWIWQRQRTADGYPIVRFGQRKRQHQVHRLVLEMKHGAPLGSQAAHHVCANSMCVNPDHLQPVTHRDNVAEMLSRQSYLARIRDLEAALAEVDPTHPLLAVVAVA